MKITEKARRINQNIKVIAFTLSDDEPKTMQKFRHALEDSVKNGNWIIVDNVHLVKSWPPEILYLFYVSLCVH